MRRIAFIAGIMGLGILVAMLIPAWDEVETLEGVAIGEIVSISGEVSESRAYGKGRLLVINEMDVYCDNCKGSYAGYNVVVVGSVERFPEDLRIRAFFIELEE